VTQQQTSHLTPLLPARWRKPSGYANGLVGRGTFALIGGQVGWDTDGRFPETFVDQVRQTLQNISTLLAEAGTGPHAVARMTWYVTDMDEYRSSLKALGAAYREVFGTHYPAMALVQVVSLVEREAKVEIEATAILPEE
jgi:enamine deaminase RidA (YjgF/YER057c/UK114 family)